MWVFDRNSWLPFDKYRPDAVVVDLLKVQHIQRCHTGIYFVVCWTLACCDRSGFAVCLCSQSGYVVVRAVQYGGAPLSKGSRKSLILFVYMQYDVVLVFRVVFVVCV